MNKSQYKNTLGIIIFFTFLLSFFFSNWETIGIGITIIAALNFYYYSKESFDIRHLIILVAVIQWIFGSVLSYHFVPDDDAYRMKVAGSQYFSFVIPGVFFFALGLLIPLNYTKINKAHLKTRINLIRKKNKNLDIILLLTGIIFSVFDKLAPQSLRFTFFLLSGIQYVGLIMLLSNPFRQKKKLILIISGILLLIIGILNGGFGLIFTWLIVSYIIYDYLTDISLKQKIIMLVLAVSVGYLMQSVKMQYRAITWLGDKEYSASEKLSIFTDLLMTKQEIEDEKTDISVISRINQGWIISEIIANMENYGGTYLEGETIYQAILSTVLPGSLYKDKRKAGGQEYFTRFTGRRIGKSTSMNIGVIGEAYGNYGRLGAFIFMFIFGLFLNYCFKILINVIIKNPLIIFFIPMIFQQVIKAEGDFFIVLNHLVKSSIFVYLIYFILSRIYKLKV